MSEPVRVLQVLGGTTLCGAESRIMDLYRNIDKNKVQFDFVVHNQNEDYFNQEIRSLGGNIYRIPRFKFFNILSYRKAWKEFFQRHQKFQAVHGHMTSTASIYLPIAKKAGVPVTIAHARSAGTDPGLKGKLTRFLRRNLSKKTDYCFACSKLAGEAVFGKSAMDKGVVQIIPNAIEVHRYLYDSRIRDEIRDRYTLKDCFVMGHVGRFHYAKNHAYLMEVFAEVAKRQNNARLLLVGEGELMEPVRERAEELGVLDRVVFAGSQGNVAAYFQAMDYVVFPSHFEGLPGTIVEAQAAGLKCLISDAITDEVMVTHLVKARSIQEPAEKWAEQILAEQKYERTRDITRLQKYGFDVVQQVKDYEAFYTGKIRKKVLLIVPMLHQGGFERVCVKTARLLEPYCDVKILIFSDEDIAFDISGLDVTNINIGFTSHKLHKVFNVWRRVRKTKELKKTWKIDISYSFGITANLVNVLSKVQDIVWVGIRGYLDVESRLHPIICKRADKIVGVSKGIQAHIQKEYPKKDVVCIYNSFETERIRALGEEAILPEEENYFKETRVIAAMGREDDVKGFWHLIRVFAHLQQENQELRLVIVGEGEFLTDKAFAQRLGVEDKILFTGVRKNPFAYLRRADLFAMTSLSEGFPNSLVEAMVLGIPVISTNCPSGPSEILCEDYQKAADTHKVYEGEYGVLVPNLRTEKVLETGDLEKEEEILMNEIRRLLFNEKLLKERASHGKERAEQFTEEKYIDAILYQMKN